LTSYEQVSLGAVGKNVGAGMTGGLAYVYDDGKIPFPRLINSEIVKIQRVQSKAGEVGDASLHTKYSPDRYGKL
jgi:glutamate synthase (ferredoxin)